MPNPTKGRGALSRLPGRFSAQVTESVVDEVLVDEDNVAPQTTLHAMSARSIVSRNQSPDVPFDHSINPYLGCEHGCVYCYARPGHSYLDLSPGLDFETEIFYKPNAAERLRETWEKPGYEVKPITIGANTDPYQPAEKKLGITRSLLELFLEYRHPVSLISKGVLMVRDLDLLSPLADRGLCSVALSVPTIDRDLKRIMEPRVPAAERRFDLMEKLADAGVPVSLMIAPVIPMINDREIEKILERGANAGATNAAYIMLRLPLEVRPLFIEWLEGHFPDRAKHVLSLVREAAGGRDYDNRFGHRMRGQGEYASMIRQRFKAACRRYGVSGSGREERQSLDCSQFRRPGPEQISLGF